MNKLINNDGKLVFDEYIRCNLSNLNFRDSKRCRADMVTTTVEADFKECVCVPIRIYDFTKKFFFIGKELGECSCPVFGSCGTQKAGYAVCDAVNLNGKSKSISNLIIEMGIAPVDSDLKRIYAMLLCAYLGEIINQNNIGLNFPQCTAFSTMVDKIEEAYIVANSDTNELLCKIYFYICICIRGSDTIAPRILYSFLDGILKYSENSRNDIWQDLDEVLEGVKRREKYINILNNHPNNCLACVCTILEIVFDRLNKNSNFYSILEHFKTAFLCYKTSNPIEISNLTQEFKERLKK